MDARRIVAYLLIGLGGAGGAIALVISADRTLQPSAEFDPLMPSLIVLGFAVMVMGAGLRSRAAAQAALGAALCILGAALLVAGRWAPLPIDVSAMSATMPARVRAMEIVVGLIFFVIGITEFVRSPVREALPKLPLPRPWLRR
jgi:F0F1-type ATP synthase membrane subunit c/vacuolar-type H+-ATPase subunit K